MGQFLLDDLFDEQIIYITEIENTCRKFTRWNKYLIKSNSSISSSLETLDYWFRSSSMVAKGNYLCEVFEKKVPIIIQAQMGKLTNCIFLLFDGTNVHVPIPIAILATTILATWLGLYRFYFGYKKNHGFCMNKIWSNLIVYFWIHFLFLWLIL